MLGRDHPRSPVLARIVAAAALCAALAGCPTSGDDAQPGCQFAGEQGEGVAATAEREDDVGAALTFGEPYTASLPPGEGGWVSLEVEADQRPTLLFVEQVGAVTGLFRNQRDDDQLPEGTPNPYCPDELPEHFYLELSRATWHLRLAPAEDDAAWLLLTDVGGHDPYQ